MKKDIKVGIALSGGGVRGIAHLGVLKALNEAGIFPGMVAGTSAGAIAGAFYCSGFTPDQIFEIIEGTNFIKLLKPAISWKGILKMDSIESLYGKYLASNDFSNLKVPLVIAATDLTKAQISYFYTGEIIRPLMASTCIPGVFDPISIDGHLFIDGGILNNMPMDPLKDSCEYIIGVNCNHLTEVHSVSNIKKLIERTVIMAMNCNVYSRKPRCDFFIEPPSLATYGAFEIKKAREIFDTGYNATLSYLEKNKKLSDLGKLEAKG